MTPIVLFVVLIFAFGLVSRRAERTVITGPMVFTTAGIIVAWALPALTSVQVEAEPIVLFGEVALALVLFTDATRISVRTVLREADLPARLLGIGMPLTLVAGTVLAALLFTELPVWEAAILATILMPTDAGLGQAVLNNPRVPVRLRQALNVEGGLNDAISLPFLMLFISLATTDPKLGSGAWIAMRCSRLPLARWWACLVVGLEAG